VPDNVDLLVARLAAMQWSVVDVTDLRRCGLSATAIAWRVANGRLFKLHRGVYSVIPNLTVEGLFLAAVKACGLGAVLSHFSAAVLYGWFVWDGRFPEVTAPEERERPGIYSHRSTHIERVVVKGIPVTPPLRTIIDLSGKLPYAGTRRAVNEALNRGQIKPVDLVTSHHRGAKNLREILLTAAPTRNEYEDLVLELLHRAGLGPSEVNRRRGGFEPDFRWPEHRVILEADSERYHGHLVARANDNERQAILEARGETVVRTTWKEAVTAPEAMLARVRQAIESGVVRAECA
jgi:very-short-patch-repair endonuclease